MFDCINIIFSTFSVVSLVLLLLRTIPAFEKTRSLGTDVAGTQSRLLTISYSLGYKSFLSDHHFKGSC